MQKALDYSHLSTEVSLLELLIDEQNHNSDQSIIPVAALGQIARYVQARDTVLLLFDPENPRWVNRKVLGDKDSWKAENGFLLKNSPFCQSLPEEVEMIAYGTGARVPYDPLIHDETDGRMIVAPLRVNRSSLGALLFLDPVYDVQDPERRKFLQLVVRALTNSIRAAQRNQQLIVSNAELEATYWQVLHSRNTLRTFFDNIPSSVYIVDRSYNIVAINTPRAARIAKRPQDLVGEKCYQKLLGYSSPCTECRVMDALNGIPSVRSSRELGPNETFIHWETTTVPIREDSNEINQVIVFEEDVTEKWILEANLIQSEKMASIGQLAANVAHEINNPLAAIIANAQLLLRDLSDADENTLDSLRLIETAGDRAAKIVSNLLESARRDRHYEFEEISLNETILDALSLLRYEINKRSITVRLSLQKDLPPLFAHKNQLKGVWINMINNAIGAIESKPGKISITTRYENNQFYVCFADNGKGILPEHVGRIFEPFFTTKEAGKGTGLGLSVSLQVIHEHHGDIEVESKPGKGAKFVIILPDIGPEN